MSKKRTGVEETVFIELLSHLEEKQVNALMQAFLKAFGELPKDTRITVPESLHSERSLSKTLEELLEKKVSVKIMHGELWST